MWVQERAARLGQRRMGRHGKAMRLGTAASSLLALPGERGAVRAAAERMQGSVSWRALVFTEKWKRV